MKRSCYRCRALKWSRDSGRFECSLGYSTMVWEGMHPFRMKRSLRDTSSYIPCEACPKPVTYAQLEACENEVSDKLPEFGDVLYTPCRQFRDRRNFVSPSIVEKTITIDDKVVVISRNVFGECVTTPIEEIGVSVFETRFAANNKLSSMCD